jgi:2-dehydropantoate 2-reductase
MRILVVGAGAGRDVTFLVRPGRAEQLAAGLFVRSSKGDVHIPAPKLLTEAALIEAKGRGGGPGLPLDQPGGPMGQPFDLILLSCKAFDLDGALESCAPAMGPGSMVLPLLNGLAHIEKLQKRFGNSAVLGGQCQISTTLDAQGRVVHLNDWHQLSYGELDGSRSARVEAVSELFAGTKLEPQLSTTILQDMWEKWIFIATMAGITCLMRASLGDIETAGGRNIALALFEECATIAGKNLHVPAASTTERIRKVLTTPGSTLTASMLRDAEAHRKTEHEHLLGDLLARAHGARVPVLETCLVHMRAYEARRLREG